MPVAKLDNAPRCRHSKADGSTCKAPALRHLPYCHFHLYVRRPAKPHTMPFVEDAHSLQLAIHQVLRALADGTLDRKTACAMLYGLQIAASNLKRLAQEREPIDAEAEGRHQMSLAQLLIDRLDLEPEPADADHESDDGAPHLPASGRSGSSWGQDNVAQPPSAVHGVGANAPSRSSSVIPEVHACAEELRKGWWAPAACPVRGRSGLARDKTMRARSRALSHHCVAAAIRRTAP